MASVLGSTPGIIVGVGVGAAVSTALEPAIEIPKQEAWNRNQNRLLDSELLARLYAQGGVELDTAYKTANRQGYSNDKLDALIYLAQSAPGEAELMFLWRLGYIDEATWRAGMVKLGRRPDWIDRQAKTFSVPVSAADVAMAIQQGHLPDPGILPGIGAETIFPAGYSEPPSPDGGPPSTVPLTQIDLDPIAMAQAYGVSVDQLKVLANLAGLPPGPHDLLQMWNRNEIDESSVDAGIREGHMKTKWAEAFKRMRWAVLTPQEYASARLRAWITAEESYAGGALTGHTKEQMDLMFLNRGRPASPTQMWRGWARGVTGPRGVPVAYEDHAKAIAISDIRPEYAEMLWEIRFNYPSLYQLGRIVQSGAITPETAAEWAKYNLYAPAVVEALTGYWQTIYPGEVGTGAGKPDAHVTKAATQLWTTTHRSYIAQEAGDTDAKERFTLLGIPATAQMEILQLWQSERALTRKQLTPAQVKKAWSEQVKNPATGQPWTQAEAQAALVDRGYSTADATTFLEE